MANGGKTSSNGSPRLDRIERVVELLVNNQLAMQEQHDQDFKKLMTWQVLMQDHMDKLTARVETMAARVDKTGVKVDQQADKIEGVIERIDKLVIAIGEIRSNPGKSRYAALIPQRSPSFYASSVRLSSMPRSISSQ